MKVKVKVNGKVNRKVKGKVNMKVNVKVKVTASLVLLGSHREKSEAPPFTAELVLAPH